MPYLGDAELWASFGLPGLIIFALFVTLLFMVWFMVSRIDNMDKRNDVRSRDQANMHRDERREWKKDSERQLDRFEQTITRLVKGLKETSDK